MILSLHTNDLNLEHPGITSALLTGYPTGYEPEVVMCDKCGCDLTDEPVYEDDYYQHLCQDCLLKLHAKWE